MSSIEIAPLTTASLPEVLRIERRCQAFPWNEPRFLSCLGDNYRNFVLHRDRQCVAFAIVQIVLDEATLFNFAVDPDWQRQGLGRQLLTHVIAALAEQSVHTLWLEVRASNRPAIALYEQLGFNQVTVRRNYYPAAQGREDAIIMACLPE